MEKNSAARPPEAYPGMSMRIAASLDLCIPEVASLILGDLWHLHDDMLVTFYLPNGKFTILGIFWDNFSMLLGHLKQIPVIVADIGT